MIVLIGMTTTMICSLAHGVWFAVEVGRTYHRIAICKTRLHEGPSKCYRGRDLTPVNDFCTTLMNFNAYRYEFKMLTCVDCGWRCSKNRSAAGLRLDSLGKVLPILPAGLKGNLKSADVIRSSYYIHGPWVDEINFCRFRCVINDGPYTLL